MSQNDSKENKDDENKRRRKVNTSAAFFVVPPRSNLLVRLCSCCFEDRLPRARFLWAYSFPIPLKQADSINLTKVKQFAVPNIPFRRVAGAHWGLAPFL